MDRLSCSNTIGNEMLCDRSRRAIACLCAAVVVRDSDNKLPTMELLLGIADEFTSYIEGDDSALFTPDMALREHLKKR